MARAAERDLYIEQGATFTLRFTWRKGTYVDGELVAGDPYDLTGHSARMQIRRRAGSDVLVDASTSNGRIELGDEGAITVRLADEDTDLLTTKTGVYDLEIETPGGDVRRLLQGKVEVSPNVTQDL